MIERHWKGIAKKGREHEYIDHLKNDTFRKLQSIKGFIAASILKREVNQGLEFLVVTKWENIEAIKQFAGSSIDVAVVPELVQDIMLNYDDKVAHYEVEYALA
jgi:heme-degrading monooxygenase HmoA